MAPTKKQKQVFEALLFLIEKGEMPTVREVGALLGLRSPATVMKHLRALEREGLISLSGKSRGIRAFPPRSGAFPPHSPRGDGGDLPGSISRAGRGGGIPVLGRIAAGRPIEAVPVEAAQGEAVPVLSIDPDLFAGSGELMSLLVSGDSMIEVGILDGDHVIIRRQPVVEEGEIAAVEIDGEVTLKRWQRPGGAGDEEGAASSVRLLPANARFEPIKITEDDHKEVRVLGKYVGLVRGFLK